MLLASGRSVESRCYARSRGYIAFTFDFDGVRETVASADDGIKDSGGQR